MANSRKDIGRRVKAKGLKKLLAKKKAHPDDYVHETSDESKLMSMKYDYDRNLLPPFKKEQYEQLKKRIEEQKRIEMEERMKEDEEEENETEEPNGTG